MPEANFGPGEIADVPLAQEVGLTRTVVGKRLKLSQSVPVVQRRTEQPWQRSGVGVFRSCCEAEFRMFAWASRPSAFDLNEDEYARMKEMKRNTALTARTIAMTA